MQSFSDELKQALLQWDDTDEETRAASKARLEALDPQVFPRISAFLQNRARISLSANCIGVGSFVTLNTVVFSFWMRYGSRAPMSLVMICLIVGLFAAALVGVLTASWAASSHLAVRAIQALTVLEDGEGIGILAEITYASSPVAASVNTISRQALIRASKRLMEEKDGAEISLSARQWDCLRHFVASQDSELSAALVRFFLHTDNAYALPQVRRLVKQTRDWDAQQAANDYLRRFAPEEMSSQHPLQAPSPADTESNTAATPILACVMRLGSRDLMERRTAENTLRTMQAEELKQILLLLGQEPPADKRVSHTIIAVCVAVGALLGSLMYFWAVRWTYFDAHMASTVAFACAFGFGAFGYLKAATINYNRRNRRRARILGSTDGLFPEKRLLETLACLDNVALVGTILDLIPSQLTITGEAVRRTLRKSLQNLLPRLRANDASLLSEQHRILLNNELQRSQLKLSESWTGGKEAEVQADLDVAILKAWEQVGDERALPIVQKLAAMTAKSPAKKRVKEAAEQCLPYLEARAGEQRQMQTLLRASDVPVEAGDILLRAATTHSTPVEAEQLLRAGIRNNNE